MTSKEYKVSYPDTYAGGAQNPFSPNNYESKISRMSMNYTSQVERYSRPEIPTRAAIKYKYDDMNNLASMSNINMNANGGMSEGYPSSGKHSRFPVLINCDGCSSLTMTDTEYEHGCASYTWCLLLLPFFCTGFCCLCLNSCKDVKHYCSRCRKEAGVCKSRCV